MEVWGASTLPSAPESSPMIIEETEPDQKVPTHLFVEIFAGKGALTAAVRAVGVESRGAGELENGGTDFADPDQVEQ